MTLGSARDGQESGRSLREVVALCTLPAIWHGAAPLRIAESLASALFTILDPVFVYVSFTASGPDQAQPVAVAQVDRFHTSAALAQEIGSQILNWAREHDSDETLVLVHPSGPGKVHVTTRPLGLYAELGVLAAAFRVERSPRAMENLILNVAATQASTAIQNSRLLESLRESEQRFRTLIDASAQIVWTAAPDGSIVEDSAGWRAFTGQTHEQRVGWGWLDALHPEDRDRAAAQWRQAVTQRTALETEYRLRHVSGQWRRTAVRALPRVNASGAVREWVGMNTDITEQREAERTQQLLIGELNHRVKNTLATVQSIAQLTLRQTASPEQFAESFRGRIQALSRIHSQLAEANWQGTILDRLILDQLLESGVESERLQLRGPRVGLPAGTALHLAMVLHELGTNSRKYGALSGASGCVIVNWETKGGALHFTWRESGGPVVPPPRSLGFGTKLIKSSAESAGGRAEVRFDPQGVGWDIQWPVEQQASSREVPLSSAINGSDDAERIETMTARMKGSPCGLEGKRILVVEDETLIALDIMSWLAEARVVALGPATTPQEALDAIAHQRLDAALLDANLHGMSVESVAAALTASNIPFGFVTGYSVASLPRAYLTAPKIAKPFTSDELLRLAGTLVSRQPQ